ncbi:MAG: pentapeptide repeat-containing protein [Desulfobacteraceae bacterium]|nr:MAG: pentapeptide repeat-containing protein [Desulfobacteraceae bacterium]
MDKKEFIAKLEDHKNKRKPLTGLNMDGCALHHTDLEGLILIESVLRNVDFNHSQMEEVEFIRCELDHCNFEHADLPDANFSGSKLNHCNLSHCTLSGANLSETTLTDCDLQDANLVMIEVMDAVFHQVRVNDKTDFHQADTSAAKEFDIVHTEKKA